LGLVNLAGGVAHKSQVRLLGGDARTVVDDADKLLSPAFHLDADAGRARVDGIFNQLFDDGGRAFDHFACRDLVAYVLGEDANRCPHPISSLARSASCAKRLSASKGVKVSIWTFASCSTKGCGPLAKRESCCP